jgi:CubicO group peptidase (beta-lactamase class C family)
MHNAPNNQELKERIEQRLEPLVRQVVASHGVVGLGLGIMRGGELVYAQGFGVRDLTTGEPARSRSLFHIDARHSAT